ncbi:hypothetical protein V8E36_003606 [Tilletia maclaganii]
MLEWMKRGMGGGRERETQEEEKKVSDPSAASPSPHGDEANCLLPPSHLAPSLQPGGNLDLASCSHHLRRRQSCILVGVKVDGVGRPLEGWLNEVGLHATNVKLADGALETAQPSRPSATLPACLSPSRCSLPRQSPLSVLGPTRDLRRPLSARTHKWRLLRSPTNVSEGAPDEAPTATSRREPKLGGLSCHPVSKSNNVKRVPLHLAPPCDCLLL